MNDTRSSSEKRCAICGQPGTLKAHVQAIPCPDDECYCDFGARRFFGCRSVEHVPPCPQACECSCCTARLALRKALSDLVKLKDHKDQHGRDDAYRMVHDGVWQRAREALK